MPVKRVGKFLECEDLGITPSLGIESGMIEECVGEIRRRKLRGAFGSSRFGFHEDNLEFLKQLPELEQVWFWDIDLKDIDGLYCLNKLRFFGIHEKRPAIDFSRFAELEHVVWFPRAGDHGLEKLSKVRNLDLWRFKSADKSYRSVRLPASLEKLEINWSNPVDLAGFPQLPWLKELQFHYCRNLTSLAGIERFAANLKRLIVTHCANLRDYSSVEHLDLERLYINIKGKEVADQ